MSIANYSDLQAAVSAWMLRASTDAVVTAAQVKNYIFLTEAELNRELRVRELESTASLSTVAAQDYVTLPSDFKKLSDLQFDDFGGNLDFMADRQELKRKWTTTSDRPQNYAIFGTKILLGPNPDTIYPMTLSYYAAITALSDSNTTNVILTAFPDIYLYGALRQAYMQTKDKANKAEAEANYAQAVQAVVAADMEARMPKLMRAQTHRRLA